MKIIRTLLMFFCIISFAQENRLSDLTPPSPSAYSLTQFAAQQPSLYTGTANISIPLYMIDFDGWKLPLSLNYHASGIMTNQEATEVGLGWALSSTAVITRRVKKINDLYKGGIINNNIRGKAYDNVHSIDDIMNERENWDNVPMWRKVYLQNAFKENLIDTEPDIFDYNFFGFTGSFVLSNKNDTGGVIEVIKITQDAVKIRYIEPNDSAPRAVGYFEITTPNGFKGVFDIKEKTTNFSGSVPRQDGPHKEQAINFQDLERKGNDRVVTGWYVSSIQSPSNETITFKYNINNNQNSSFISLGVPSISDYVSGTDNLGTDSFSRLVVEHVYQTEIVIANKLKINFFTEYREDLQKNFLYSVQFPVTAQKPKRYTGIIISGLNPSSTFNKTIEINQSYFHEDHLYDQSLNGIYQELDKYGWLRSRLDNVKIDDQVYRFHYNKGLEGLPSKYTRGVDYFGYYNGIKDNIVLHSVSTRSNGANYCNYLNDNPTHKFYYQNSERWSNKDYAIAGSLHKVVYPTGGYTEYEYESHDYFAKGSNGIEPYHTPEAININGGSGTIKGGGLRIAAIRTYHKENELASSKKYLYKDDQAKSTGVMLTGFGYFYRTDLTGLVENGSCTDVFHSSVSIPGQQTAEGKRIGYSRVTEITEGEEQDGMKTDHYFTNIPTRTFEQWEIVRNTDYKNGKLTNQYLAGIQTPLAQSKEYDLYENFNNAVKGLGYYSKILGSSYFTTFYPYELPIGFAKIDYVKTTNELGSNDITQERFYTFNNSGQVTSEKVIDSRGRSVKTVYKRLLDFSDSNCTNASDGSGCIQSKMREKNIVNLLLEQINYIDIKPISAIGYRYDIEHGNIVLRNQYINSKPVYNFTGSSDGFSFTGDYRNLITYNDYDSYGNLLQTTDESGVSSSLIWGYDNEYPIVKGDNIVYNSLLSSYNSYKNNPTYENDIRNNSTTLKNAFITTYEYDPMVGVLKITDPSERFINYEYDQYGRLLRIKDQDQKITQEYEYNFREEPKTGGLSVNSNLSFGLVNPGDTKTLQLVITNDGNYDVTINQLNLPTYFSSSLQYVTKNVSPGGIYSVPITFTAPSQPIQVNNNLTIESSNNLEGNVNVNLTAEVAEETRILRIGNTNHIINTEFGSSYLDLYNDGNSPIKILNIVSDDSCITNDWANIVTAIDSGGIPYTVYYEIPGNRSTFPVTVRIQLTCPLNTNGNWDGNATLRVKYLQNGFILNSEPIYVRRY